MANFYFDSSAIVKRYIPEVGSAWVRSVCAPATGNRICTVAMTKVEFSSAVCRRCREGFISVTERDRLIRTFLAHCMREYRVMGATAARLNLAIDLAKRHPLRTYDAVQLAVALTLNQSLINASLPPLTFVSADGQLATAAAAEGLATDNPNAHP